MQLPAHYVETYGVINIPRMGITPTSSGLEASNPGSPTSTSSSGVPKGSVGTADDDDDDDGEEDELGEAEVEIGELEVETGELEADFGDDSSVASPSGPMITGGNPGGGGIIPGPGMSGTTIIARGANHIGRMVKPPSLFVVVVTETEPELPLKVDIVSIDTGPVYVEVWGAMVIGPTVPTGGITIVPVATLPEEVVDEKEDEV